jgi:hypothetical protein
VGPIGADRVPSFAPDLGHVIAIAADRQAAFATCLTSLLGRKLMGSALAVRRLSALARNLALLFSIHRGKAACSIL